MKKIILLIIVFTFCVTAQQVNIVPFLKQIEKGETAEAQQALNEFKRTNPEAPEVQFLDAVLTEDGEEALKKYEQFYNRHPNHMFADAALYRVFSYYYSLGIYNRAEGYLAKLKSDYPDSPYIKAADRSIPDEEDVIIEETGSGHQPKSDPPQPLPKKTGQYTVQAGAFLNIENAKKLQQSLEADGYSVELGTKSVGGSLLNVVKVGKYDNMDEASELLNHLKAKYSLNGRVIELTK